MGGVDVGGGGGRRRATNGEVNMVPFIDLLLVTVAFLLITAVWTTNSRIEADAQVPGPPGCGADCGDKIELTLHVRVEEDGFSLQWKQGSTVISESRVARPPVDAGAPPRYLELAERIAGEWAARGVHRDPTDRKADQAIIHTDDRTAFREIVGVLDAVHATHRDLRTADGTTRKVPAFALVFAQR